MSTSNGVIAFFGGLAAGATLGVLFAPQSGKETRDMIGDKVSKKKEQVEELIAEGRKEWSKARGKTSDAATMTRDEVDDLIKFILSEGKDLFDRVSDNVKDAAAEGGNNP